MPLSLADAVHDKVTAFVKNSDAFQRTTCECFEQLDYKCQGKITVNTVAACVEILFEELQSSLKEYGIVVEPISSDEVYQLFREVDKNGNDLLDQEEFTEFYAKVVTYAAMRSAVGFGRKYGMAMVYGFIGTVIAKRAIRAVPIAGLVASPFLALIPGLIVGPVLGVAVCYGLEKKDIFAFKKKLFPPKPGAE